MLYELRDHPDDFPIIRATLADARKRARKRVEQFGFPVLIYEMNPFTGEKLIETVQ